MADREPFCFLAPVVSGQSHQWREDHRERSPPNQQPSHHCFKDGGQHAAEKRYLSRSAVSSTQNQARSPVCDQGHGGKAGPLGLPHAALWDEIRRPRSGLLRASTPRVTDQAPQVQRRHPRIPTDPDTRGSLTTSSFWGVGRDFYSNMRSTSARMPSFSRWIMRIRQTIAVIFLRRNLASARNSNKPYTVSSQERRLAFRRASDSFDLIFSAYACGSVLKASRISLKALL